MQMLSSPESSAGLAAVLKCVSEMLRQIERELEDPDLGATRASETVPYKLGYKACCKSILELPRLASIENQEGRK